MFGIRACAEVQIAQISRSKTIQLLSLWISIIQLSLRGIDGFGILKILQIIILIDIKYIYHQQQKTNMVTKIHHYCFKFLKKSFYLGIFIIFYIIFDENLKLRILQTIIKLGLTMLNIWP